MSRLLPFSPWEDVPCWASGSQSRLLNRSLKDETGWRVVVKLLFQVHPCCSERPGQQTDSNGVQLGRHWPQNVRGEHEQSDPECHRSSYRAGKYSRRLWPPQVTRHSVEFQFALTGLALRLFIREVAWASSVPCCFSHQIGCFHRNLNIKWVKLQWYMVHSQFLL